MGSVITLLLIYLVSALIFGLVLYWLGFGVFTSFVVGLAIATIAISSFWDGLYDQSEEASAAFLTSLTCFSYFLLDIWFILVVICTLTLLFGGKLNKNRLTDALFGFNEG